MRIGIFDPYLDTLGGGEKYMLTAAYCLAQKHEVFVFWNEKDILKKASEKFSLDLSKIKLTKNIFDTKTPFYKRYSESKEYDAIFYLSDGSLPLVATKLFVHFQFPVEWVNPKSLLFNIKNRRIVKFICNSYFTKKFIDEKFSVKSEVLYPPTYFKKDLPKIIKDKKNYILNVGRLASLPDATLFKKQDFIIETFRHMVDEGLKNWELHLVVSFLENDAQLFENLVKLTKGYPIIIHKNVSYKKLCELYLQSKIYWHASGFGENLIRHPEKAEHFGITTVEAMSNGLVPVVINEGGQKEIVDNEKNGFLFSSEKELKEQTSDLIRNNAIFETMSKEAEKKAKSFTVERFCEGLYEIFEN